MLVMDSIGLGIFTAVGVMTGIHEGYVENTFLLVVLGTLTGLAGFILLFRDNRRPGYFL